MKSIVMESILTSVKKMLGISEEYEHFDHDLIMHINSVFTILNQLGAGPAKGFMITDKTAVWSDFISNEATLQIVKSYMYLKVKLLFDPPLGSAVIESINRQISEFEWRIEVGADSEGGGTEDQQFDQYTGEYQVIPKAFDSQTLDTANKLLEEDIVVSEVPYYETANEADGVTSYIAREGNSK